MSSLNSISNLVKEKLLNAEAGHDWLHVCRVVSLAKQIAETEPNADKNVVILAALLHDIADAKFYNGDESIGPEMAKSIMEAHSIDHEIIKHVVQIILNMSYKGGFALSDFSSLEMDIVRDADRLDAIGAIGIARAFTYGGYKNRRLYDMNEEPANFDSRESYKNHQGATFNHFYEKLIKLKDTMKTSQGQKLANQRHEFMISYMNQFIEETGLESHF
jgi:uncharacterized protein